MHLSKVRSLILDKSQELAVKAQVNVDMEGVRKTSRYIQAGGVAATLVLSTTVEAATLKEGAISIFNLIYGVVGVLGALFALVSLINWASGTNFLGRDDPKKTFFTTVIATMAAFGVVGIIQLGKEFVSPDDYSIDDL